MEKYFDLLGHRVSDLITGAEGVVTSITFDLYGCVQALINPGLDKDGKIQEREWYDLSRLKRLTTERVMPLPFHLVQGGPVPGGDRKPTPR